MLPERKDAGLLYDIISAAKDIEVFMEDCDFESFSSNKMLRYAVERQLLVIGEAARRLSEDFRNDISSVPWQAVIGLRNIIAHDYGEILTERIWLVATRDLKDLITKLIPYTSDSQ